MGIDEPGTGAMPVTMTRYGMRGTPSLILIDVMGRMRAHHFGQVSELRLGAEIATLPAEGEFTAAERTDDFSDAGCGPHCAADEGSGR